MVKYTSRQALQGLLNQGLWAAAGGRVFYHGSARAPKWARSGARFNLASLPHQSGLPNWPHCHTKVGPPQITRRTTTPFAPRLSNAVKTHASRGPPGPVFHGPRGRVSIDPHYHTKKMDALGPPRFTFPARTIYSRNSRDPRVAKKWRHYHAVWAAA